MARNKFQFQKGLSDIAFYEKYGSEAQCEAVLEEDALAAALCSALSAGDAKHIA